MSNQSFELVSGQLAINGYPEAVKVAAINDERGRVIADLTLHVLDLSFAQDCLVSINRVPPSEVVARNAIWLSSVVRFFKCFGKSKSRTKLKEAEIWSDNPEAIACFNYFKSLRGKHLVHDENVMSQCKCVAIINREGSPKKVAQVIGLAMIQESLDQEHYNPMSSLINSAIAWVNTERDRMIVALAHELELDPNDKLMALPSVDFRKSTSDDIGKTR